MSIELKNVVSTRKSFKLGVFADYQPANLKAVADKLEKTQSGLDVKSTPEEIQKLINEFLADLRHKNEDLIHSKWIHKKRALLDILVVVGRKGALQERDYRDTNRILESILLILISQQNLPARFLEAIGRAVLNNCGNARLWKMFVGALDRDGQRLGKRAMVWKTHQAELSAPDMFVERQLKLGTAILKMPEQLSVENTWFGNRITRAALHRIAGNLLQTYRKELIGDFSLTHKNPDFMGFLADSDIETLSAFVNSYCSNINVIPQMDVFIEYLISSKIMNVPSAGVKWSHPLIHERSRKLIEKYLLSADFRMAFDHILMHQERKNYWIKWLESGHVRRIRVFGNLGKIKRYNFDCPVGAMEFPTLQMDLGPCYAFECGQQGSGALYVYPTTDGPISWDHKLEKARSYKSFILDRDSSLPTGWFSVTHNANWRQNVDMMLLQYYRLKR
jgi:hypothetical protein